jgi:hypothetical protein
MRSLLASVGVVAVMAWVSAFSPAWAKQPNVGPMDKLQKLAEQQGHPEAAVKQLGNLGFQVTQDMEAAAMGITPDDVQAAARRGGAIDARLEAVLKRPLTADEKRRIADAARQFAASLEAPRQEYLQDIARATGLSAAQVQQIALPKGRQDPVIDTAALAKIEAALGHKLVARQLNQIRAADDRKRSAADTQQDVLTRQISQTSGIPPKFVAELMK